MQRLTDAPRGARLPEQRGDTTIAYDAAAGHAPDHPVHALGERRDRFTRHSRVVQRAPPLRLHSRITPQAIERMLRAWGDSLRRMAEVEADLWRTEVMEPLFAAGVSAAEIGPRTAEFSNALAPIEERAILASVPDDLDGLARRFGIDRLLHVTSGNDRLGDAGREQADRPERPGHVTRAGQQAL